jgi:hypothetical protein
MYSYCKFCGLTLLLLIVDTWAAVLFQDDFGNPGYSAQNWTLVSTDGNKLQFVDSKATIINNDETYSALAVHSLNEELSSFTVCAKVSSEFPGSGLYFCFDDMRNGYRGYAVLLGDDRIYIYKFYPESVSVIGNQTSAFVKPVENYLKISRFDDKIRVFCNGYYIFTVADDEFHSGDFALIVPPVSEAFFDDVLIENRIADTSHFETFIDDFLEKNFFGWTRYGNAITDYLNSNLQVQTGNYQKFYNCVEVPLNSFAMKTVVQYNQGDSSSFYGFFIKKMTESDTNDHFYHFAVSADKKFVISSSRDSLLEPVPIKNSTKVTALDYDTLELIRDNDVFTFIVNGTKLGECSEISGVINGAGLFVSSKLNVAFDKFQIMNIGLQTSNGKIIKRDSGIRLVEKSPLRIDLLGRSIPLKEITLPSKGFLEIKNGGKWEKRIRVR